MRFVVCAFTFLARTHSVEEQSPQAKRDYLVKNLGKIFQKFIVTPKIT